MRITMLETVESAHDYAGADENGNPTILRDVRKMPEGAVYDESNGGPDWERRAARLVSLGYAVAG